MLEKELLENVYKSIIEVADKKRLITNFKDLDKTLVGVDKGDIVTIGGRPAMGKSSFAISILYNLLKQNKKCLFFSLMMSKYIFVKRLIAQIKNIDLFTLNSNKFVDKNISKDIKKALDIMSTFNLTLFDDINKIDEIKEKIKFEKPDYVFIDYLQVISTSTKKNRNESISNIIIDLKKVAKENDCIIFILSQLSRAVEQRIDKRPFLSDLRDSGDIESVSDVILFIYRSEYYFSSEDIDYEKDYAEIIIAKNKNGPICTINLLFRRELAKFMEPYNNDEFVF